MSNDECPSDICDLDTGSCIADSEILYASPEGSAINDCTKGSPCDWLKALKSIDVTHTTVIATPGEYTDEAAVPANVTALIIGQPGATILAPFGTADMLSIGAGSTVTIRDLVLQSDEFEDPRDVLLECAGTAATKTKLVVRNVQAIGTVAGFFCDVTVDHAKFGPLLLVGGSSEIAHATINGINFRASDRLAATVTNSVIASVNVERITNAAVDVSFSTIPFGLVAPANQTGVALTNNIITAFNANDEAVNCLAPCAIDLVDNLLSLQSAPLSLNNLIGDPLFVNKPAQDYHLQESSPAIDRASGSGPSTDLDDGPRPAGSAPDLGAYEFVP